MTIFEASPWSAPLFAAVLSAAALALLVRGQSRLPQDYPTGRSLHDRPVSRVGGIAIWAGFLPVACLAPPPPGTDRWWLVAWAFVAAVSLADDWFGLRPAIRLAAQALAALVVAATLPWPESAPPSLLWQLGAIAATALIVVWSANLFNFMDGSDGLAALMSACGFSAYGAAALFAGAPADAFFALAAASLVFLAVNRPPAKAFMGDGGSVGLGFLAAAFGCAGVRAEAWPAWFPLLAFLPFIADATVTMGRRVMRGDHLFEAHRTHYYQKLHRMGPGHRGTLALYGLLIVGTSASALVVLGVAPGMGWWALAVWTTTLGVLFAGIDYHWRRRGPEEQ
jgi:UDP-N-acetylmuramyl pentapeptide phosphotransferase/UDP-N-acetylglucosamine-1-phosphate transferase